MSTQKAISNGVNPRAELVNTCHLLYEKGFVVATEGNVSVRISPDRILITPTNTNKSLIKESQVVTIDGRGKKISGKGMPSAEFALHTEVYRLRPDVRAIIHAHPPNAVALTLAGIELGNTLPEIIIALGKVPIAKYATATTYALAKSISKLIKKHNAIILALHGSLTVGKNLREAFENLERVEWASEVILKASILGKVKHLSAGEVKKLLAIRNRMTKK